MRGWVLIVLPLLAIQVRAQQTPAEKQQACKGACNFAGCYQLTGDTLSTRSVREVINSLTLACYEPTEDAKTDPSITNPCGCNFGAIMYKEVLLPTDVCPTWPYIDLIPKQTCVEDGRNVQMGDTTIYADNDLEICLRRINNDQDFFHASVLNRKDCAYTVGVAGNPELSNSAAVMEQFRILKEEKNVLLHCSFVGNPANFVTDIAYTTYCDVTTTAADMNALRLASERMFQFLNCCRDPDPLPPTTPPPPRPCDGCAIINGVGYNPHPTRCDCWIRCVFGDDQEGVVEEITNCCGCGMFWEQDLLTCVPATDKTCNRDPCLQSGVTAWPFSDRNGDADCRGYWTCANRRTVSSSCCLAGDEFNPVTGTCVQDPAGACQRKCPCDEETTTEPTCEFGVNLLDPQTYYARQYDNQPVLMNCPPGLHFNVSDCKCSTFIQVPQEDCGMAFDMRCTEDPLVDLADNVYIRNEDVVVDVDNSQCVFTGNDRLTIPRFANQDFRDKFAIKVSFNGEGRDNDDKPIFSNTDCREQATVEIRLLRVGAARERKIEGFIRTVRGQMFSVTADYRENIRNDVYFSYNGQSLNMCVQYSDDRSVSESSNAGAEGLVKRCHCAGQIGYGWQNRYFSGRIYEVQIHTYCVPDNFCPTAPPPG